jgi:hypothetical protein
MPIPCALGFRISFAWSCILRDGSDHEVEIFGDGVDFATPDAAISIA